MIGIAYHFSFKQAMNKDRFKQVFTRFLKEHGIYSFIVGEIHREYENGFDGFFDKVRKHVITDVFNLRSILSFPWEGNTHDENEQTANFIFWHRINGIWREVCRTNDYFNTI